MFKVEVEETTYCVHVGADVMLSINDRDWGELTLEDTLLETTYCHDVEYDHFGPWIYVSILKKYDTPQHKKKVMKIIDDYARGKEVSLE